jgi:hypothetical protein
MAYSKAKFKINGYKASPYFRPFWIGKLWDRYLPTQNLLYVSFKHILISLTSFMGNIALVIPKLDFAFVLLGILFCLPMPTNWNASSGSLHPFILIVSISLSTAVSYAYALTILKIDQQTFILEEISSLFICTLVLNSVLLFWKILFFEFLIGISAMFNICSTSTVSSSARTDNVVCRDVDIFETKTVFVNHT